MRIRVEGQAVLVYEPGRLVSKSVEQYVAEIEFTDEWQGFSKFMVFATKDETVMIEQAVRDDQLTMVVPWEVLEEDGMIKVGFYGLDGAGRRPTIWSKPLLVLHGVGPGEPTREPTITPWEQMVAWIGNIADLKTEEKENLVAAVNEIYDLGGVKSVNGKTGVVVLSADDVGALPDTTHIPDKTSDLTNDSGYITEADIPEVPVKSVNSKTGNVVLDAGDVHALPDSTVVPTKTSQLQNDSGFVKRAEIPAPPVTSVNSKTGDVVLNASDVHALSENTRIPTKTSDLTNDKGFITLQEVPAAPVRSVNSKTGNVYLDAEDVGALPDDTEIPTELSQLGDDSTHRLVTDAEKTKWNTVDDKADTDDMEAADNDLQSQIDAIVAKSDVVDVVGTYAELLAYDTSKLGANDIVKVLEDSQHQNARTYYRWLITGGTGNWSYIGTEAVGYTKAEEDALLNAKADKTTLNAHTSDTDIHVTAAQKTAWDAKADESDLTEHVDNDVIHVTQQDRNEWDNKVVVDDEEPTDAEIWIDTSDSIENVDPSVRWDIDQSAILTTANKTRARTNIDAASQTEVNGLSAAIAQKVDKDFGVSEAGKLLSVGRDGKVQTKADGYEVASNKVAAISSASTSIQYPSAKSVYDYALHDWVGTQAEYDAIAVKDAHTRYNIVEAST